MAVTGIEEVLELVYAKIAVPHILSGKAVAHAIRGHFLVDAALNAMLISDTFSLPLSATLDEANTEEPVVPQPSIDEDLESAKVIYNRLTENPNVSAEVCSSEALDLIARKLEEKKQSMLKSRTAVLWIKYMEMVDTLKLFIKAETTCNWMLHLKALHEMLPYFAAAGHTLYTKSAYIYCQQMQDLPNKHPQVNRSFLNGLHVVRHIDRF